MTGRYYRVSPAFWIDHDWDDDTRLAALYVLTCPHRNTEGLFRMPLTYAATDLGWAARRFEKALRRLISDCFVEYDRDASVCLIVNALKWQTPDNPNQVKAAMKAVRQLPETPLLNRFRTLAATHSQRLTEALDQELGEQIGDPHNSTSSSNSSTPESYANGEDSVDVAVSDGIAA